MSEYPPTVDQVRDAYIEGVEHDCYYEGDVKTTPDGIYEGERFDRWLAKRDAEVERRAAGKALLRVADSNQAEAFDTAVDLSRIRGPLFVSVRTWLTRVATEYRRNEGEK